MMGIGIDIEPVQRPSQEFTGVAFSPTEQALLANLGDASQDAWPLRLWCAKEAAGKALGRGLAGGPQGIVVRRVDVNTGIVQMGLAARMAQLLPAVDGQELTAYTARDGDWVVASVPGEVMR